MIFAVYVERREFSAKKSLGWFLGMGVRGGTACAGCAGASDPTAELIGREGAQRHHCRAADGAPYIPGSAIKGAMRTGLLHEHHRGENRSVFSALAGDRERDKRASA